MKVEKKILSELTSLSKDELIEKIIKLRSGAVNTNNFDNIYVAKNDNLSHLIVENSHDGILIIGDDYKIEFVNTRLTELTGFKKKFLVNKDFRELLNSTNRDPVVKRYQQRKNVGDLDTVFELPLITPQKEHKIFEIKSTLFNDSDGNVKTLSQFKDITLRKQTEEAIKYSEERFRSIVEFSHEGIIVVDTNYHLEYANNKFGEIVGIPKRKIMGQDFRNFVSKKSLKLVVERYKKRQQGIDVPHEYEIDLIRPNGEIRNTKLSSSIVNVAGKVRTIAQILDLTETKKKHKVEKVILNISQAVNKVKNLKDFLKTVRKELSSILDTTNFYVALYNKNIDAYTFPYHVDKYDSIDDITQIELKDSLTDYVRRKNKAILVNTKKQKELEDKDEIIGIVGNACPVWIGAPLVVDKDVVGAICLQHYYDANCYNKGDLELLKIVSENVSSAIWKKQIVDQLTESELRYRDFISRSSEGIYRIDFDPPIDIKKPKDEQVHDILKYGIIGECNESFASMYRLKSNKDILGKNLNTFYGNKLNKTNFDANIHFIENNYKVTDVETIEYNSVGEQVIILNNSIGIIKGTFLENIWGIQKDITESKKQLNILKEIAKGVTTTTDESFFKSIVRFFGENLNVDHAFVAQFTDDNKVTKTLAVWNKNNLGENFEFNIENTPCELLLNNNLIYLEDVRKKYPKDSTLKKQKISHFLGKSLINSEGKVIGILILLHKKLIKNIEFEKSVLEIFASRSAVEIERLEHVKELVKAKEGAEKSNHLKSDFLAQMSHEIRTPVNTILSFSSLIKDSLENKLDEELKDSFKIIDNGGKRLIRTIDLILNVSQVQSGNLTITPTKIDLISTIKNLISEFKQTALEKKLDLSFESKHRQLTVLADNYTLIQIFANLVHNSIKYTNTGFVKVTVEKNQNKDIIIQVMDSGIGISKKYINELFDPFSQEETGYTRKFEGTGLGLTLVRKYCELNNAKIIVESRKNKGSRFIVTFKK